MQGVFIGRPKAWSFEHPLSDPEKIKYKVAQQEAVTQTIRRYNPTAPIVQNLDFGHTAPSLCLPYGGEVQVLSDSRTIKANY